MTLLDTKTRKACETFFFPNIINFHLQAFNRRKMTIFKAKVNPYFELVTLPVTGFNISPAKQIQINYRQINKYR